MLAFAHFEKRAIQIVIIKQQEFRTCKKKDYFSKKINIPSLPEQQQIVFHLDTIQSAIDNKKQQLALLDEVVKSRFIEMFGENPIENGKLKN